VIYDQCQGQSILLAFIDLHTGDPFCQAARWIISIYCLVHWHTNDL